MNRPLLTIPAPAPAGIGDPSLDRCQAAKNGGNLARDER